MERYLLREHGKRSKEENKKCAIREQGGKGARERKRPSEAERDHDKMEGGQKLSDQREKVQQINKGTQQCFCCRKYARKRQGQRAKGQENKNKGTWH